MDGTLSHPDGILSVPAALSFALDGMDNALAIFNPDGVVTYANRAALAMVGLKPEQAIGRAVENFWHDPAEVRVVLAAVTTTGHFEGELPIPMPDGSVVPMLARASAFRNSQGAVVGIVGTAVSIAQLKEKERRIEELSRAYRMISACNQALVRAETSAQLMQSVCDEALAHGEYHYASIALMGNDGELRVQTRHNFSDECRRLFGIDETGCVLPDSPIWNSAGEGRVIQLGNMASSGQAGVARPQIYPIMERQAGARPPIGALFVCSSWVPGLEEEEARLLEELAGDIAFGLQVLADRAARRAAEQRSHLLEQAIDAAVNPIMITDARGHIEYVNPAFSRVTGYSREEALGETPRLLRSGLQDQSYYEEMWQRISSGQVYRGELINRRKDGSVYLEEIIITPVPGDDGRILHYVAVKQDVTERRDLERQLRQSQKMEAIGTLAGGIAHDFNNVLAAILGYTELAELEVPQDSVVHKDLERVRVSALRARDLVQQIMAFSRTEEQRRVLVNMAVATHEALKFIRSAVPATIELIEQVDDAAGPVKAVPSQMHQIITNLCTNAYQAMGEGGGQLTVSLSQTGGGAVLPGPCVRLLVSDTGPGIPADIQERVFDPFFTTKPQGEGTGLGLAMAHSIVAAHGGTIRLLPTERGAAIEVLLPVAPEELADAPSETETHRPGGGKILVVDDEESIALMLQRRLTVLGYNACATSNSRDALDMFRAAPDEFQLVITDQQMPGLSGDQLAASLHELNPKLPIIVMTGHSEIVHEENFHERGFAALLHKPIISKELLGALNRLMVH
ncbi:MAG: hypothetical protein RLZZ303_1071 [Candidatus Hydrogenedentota bacterium]